MCFSLDALQIVIGLLFLKLLNWLGVPLCGHIIELSGICSCARWLKSSFCTIVENFKSWKRQQIHMINNDQLTQKKMLVDIASRTFFLKQTYRIWELLGFCVRICVSAVKFFGDLPQKLQRVSSRLLQWHIWFITDVLDAKPLNKNMSWLDFFKAWILIEVRLVLKLICFLYDVFLNVTCGSVYCFVGMADKVSEIILQLGFGFSLVLEAYRDNISMVAFSFTFALVVLIRMFIGLTKCRTFHGIERDKGKRSYGVSGEWSFFNVYNMIWLALYTVVERRDICIEIDQSNGEKIYYRRSSRYLASQYKRIQKHQHTRKFYATLETCLFHLSKAKCVLELVGKMYDFLAKSPLKFVESALDELNLLWNMLSFWQFAEAMVCGLLFGFIVNTFLLCIVCHLPGVILYTVYYTTALFFLTLSINGWDIISIHYEIKQSCRLATRKVEAFVSDLYLMIKRLYVDPKCMDFPCQDNCGITDAKEVDLETAMMIYSLDECQMKTLSGNNMINNSFEEVHNKFATNLEQDHSIVIKDSVCTENENTHDLTAMNIESEIDNEKEGNCPKSLEEESDKISSSPRHFSNIKKVESKTFLLSHDEVLLQGAVDEFALSVETEIHNLESEITIFTEKNYLVGREKDSLSSTTTTEEIKEGDIPMVVLPSNGSSVLENSAKSDTITGYTNATSGTVTASSLEAKVEVEENEMLIGLITENVVSDPLNTINDASTNIGKDNDNFSAKHKLMKIEKVEHDPQDESQFDMVQPCSFETSCLGAKKEGHPDSSGIEHGDHVETVDPSDSVPAPLSSFLDEGFWEDYIYNFNNKDNSFNVMATFASFGNASSSGSLSETCFVINERLDGYREYSNFDGHPLRRSRSTHSLSVENFIADR